MILVTVETDGGAEASVSMFYKIAVMGPASALRDPVRAQIKSIHIQIDLAGRGRWRAPTHRALRC